MAMPELFGPYLLHHRLAVGSTSEVFLAQTTGEYPRLCAIKRIRRELAVLEDFEQRFRHDAALLVRLGHGNIVQVLEVGTIDDRPFIAMEQIDGIDLAELIAGCARQGELPPELGLYVAIEMCEGVSHLQLRRREEASGTTFPYDMAWSHELMLSFDGVVKLVDLGASGALRLGTQPVNHLFRSPGYAAPEVILKRQLDVRSDIFAVGLVLWECLAGSRLVADDPEGYVRQVLARSWQAPLLRRKDVAGDVIRLVGECLNLDPARRPADLEQVRRRLVAVLRRAAPTYGSAALSRLLWRRCGALIADAEELTSRVARQAPTLETPPPNVHTNTYGKAPPGRRDAAGTRPAPAELKIGDRIPGTRYRLVRELGRGGSAEVYAGQHVDLERQVAIKILSPQLAESSEAIAQFRLEARACSRISHPNIVDVIDFGELDDGRFFFAMELVEGRSLAEILADDHVLDPGRAVGIFRQIAKALEAAHAQGIIHRDIKPENVMLMRPGRDGRADLVKLLDFGVMAFAGDRASSRMGTPGYMAPEQVRGAAPTPAMDIYAVGATLYEALSGSTPYPYRPLETFIHKQTKSPPPALRSHEAARDVHPALERVVHRALERGPEARHGSIAELEADLLLAQREAGLVSGWDDLAEPGEDHSRTGIKRRRPTGEAPRRNAAMLLIGGALAAAVTLGLIVLLTRTETPTRTPTGTVARPRSARPVPASPAGPGEARAAALLAQVERAVGRGHFTYPEGRSALDLLERLWQHDPDNAAAGRLRRRITEVLIGAGDRLTAAGMADSAQTLYHEALLFDPGSKRLQALLKPATRQEARARHRPAASAAALSWLIAQIQRAVLEGRYISPTRRSALHYLVRLKQLDPSGKRSGALARKMSRTLREEADRHWTAGDRRRAQDLYRVIALLRPEDALARRRATARPEPATPPPSSDGRVEQGGIARRPATRERRAGDAERARQLVAEGQALLRKGKLAAARQRFLAAVKESPREGRAVAGLATVSFEEARYAQTVELAERAVALDRRLLQAHLLLGDAYFKLLRYADAERAWRRALRLDPTNKRATRRLAMLRRRTSRVQ